MLGDHPCDAGTKTQPTPDRNGGKIRNECALSGGRRVDEKRCTRASERAHRQPLDTTRREQTRERRLKHQVGLSRSQNDQCANENWLASDSVGDLTERQHRRNQCDDVTEHEQRHDRVSEAVALLIERDERCDQTGAEPEEDQHGPDAPDATHAGTMPTHFQRPRCAAVTIRHSALVPRNDHGIPVRRREPGEDQPRGGAAHPLEELSLRAWGDIREDDPAVDIRR